MEDVIKINISELDDEDKLIDIEKTLPDYSDKNILELCSALTDEKIAMILEQTDENSTNRILTYLTDEKVIKIFSYMPKDDIVDILGWLPVGRAKKLIKSMKTGDQNDIETLLGYKEDCAGGLMTTEYISLYEKMTVGEALQKIKSISPKTELLDTLFITSDEKKLVGTVELRDVLINDEKVNLDNLIDREFKFVYPETDQEKVAQMASKYDLNVIPVINKNKALLGIITIDDIVDVMEEEQTEDILKMGGVAKEETLDTSLKESVKLRFPWLFINLLTAFLASLTIKAFESTISQVVALSAIMSIVTGMGGNAGTQTISIIIRNIAIGNVRLKNVWKLIVKEIFLGLIDGALIGLITGIVVALIYKNFYLGIIMLIAMIGNLVVAGISGIIVPITLDKLHIDPALSSSIFLTTATDVLGFFIFLSLAKLFLPLIV